MSSLLDTIGGLPVHPLVVHFAVVLLPLATMGVMVSIYIPRFRKGFAFASVVGVFLGSGAAFVAKQSGEALATHLGTPKTHANYGNLLPLIALVFFALSVLWYQSIKKSPSVKPSNLGHVLAIVGVAVLGLTFLTGHTGAEAVWKGRLQALSSSQTPAPTSSKRATGAQYSMADVAKHSKPSSCWSAINGEVYNLTKWINQHPGGPGVIEMICGKDGTAAFNGQHSGQRRPANELAGFKIGSLK